MDRNRWVWLWGGQSLFGEKLNMLLHSPLRLANAVFNGMPNAAKTFNTSDFSMPADLRNV